MNERLQVLKPTPFAFLLLLLVLVTQGVCLSSTSSSFSMTNNTPAPTIHSFGFGSPIQVSTSDHQTSYNIRWGILALNLTVSYLIATVVSIGMARAARLRRPATAYGILAMATVAITFLIAIGMSKIYWGYFLSRPSLLPEVQQVTAVRAIIPVRMSGGSGKRIFEVDDSYSLSERLANGKNDPYYCLDERILLELERRNLLPKTLTRSLSDLPELYPLVDSSGVLAKSSSGYDSLARLSGIAVDAVGRAGNRLVVFGLTGGPLSNDHYPYYELLFSAQTHGSQLEFIRGQRFFYDVAGMEEVEWYMIWLLLTILGIPFGFVIFTIVRFLRTWKYSRVP